MGGCGAGRANRRPKLSEAFAVRRGKLNRKTTRSPNSFPLRTVISPRSLTARRAIADRFYQSHSISISLARVRWQYSRRSRGGWRPARVHSASFTRATLRPHTMAGDSDMPNGKVEPDWKTGADGEAEIQCCVGFGAGIAKDFRRRRPLYGDDWSRGTGVGLKIFAPATYIFFASVLPALTFGEQFREETQELFSIRTPLRHRDRGRPPVHLRRSAPPDRWRRRAYRAGVLLHVQVRGRAERPGPRALQALLHLGPHLHRAHALRPRLCQRVRVHQRVHPLLRRDLRNPHRSSSSRPR